MECAGLSECMGERVGKIEGKSEGRVGCAEELVIIFSKLTCDIIVVSRGRGGTAPLDRFVAWNSRARQGL